MYGTDEPLPPESTHFIFSLREAWLFLNGIVGVYDNDPSFTYTVLEHLVADVVGGERCRDPVGSHRDNALNCMLDVGMSVNDALYAANQAGDLIIQAVCSVVPNFGSKVYEDAYAFLLRRPFDVVLSIEHQAFRDAVIRGGNPRPYRL